MIHIQVFTFNAFQENTYVLWDETKEALIIDPGCYEKEEREELTSFIESNKLKPIKLVYHKLDEPTHRAIKVYAPNYGFYNYEETEVDEFIEEGDTIKFGNSELKIVFVPGHAPGHVAFYNAEEKICIGGDVLFYNSIGRTDLPGGNHETLISSIKNKLFTMADDMVVYPGHGPKTTIGREKQYNPFLTGK